MPARPTLVIMAKEPRPGRVKTRLAADIGSIPAANWQKRQLVRLARRLVSPHWDTVLSVAPDRAVSSALFPDLPRIPQGEGDLGERMGRAFRSLPRGPILIIGADIPGISQDHIRASFAGIGSHKAVIGPATDGGYWAIGLDTRRPIPARLFHNVRWSTPYALTDTLATLPPPAYLPTLADVDSAQDLLRNSH